MENNNHEEKNKMNERAMTVDHDIVAMMYEPMAGFDASEVKESLEDYIDSFGLAHMLADISNEVWWLADEIDCDPTGCTKEEFDAWVEIDNILQNRIIDIIKQWNEEGEDYPTEGIGTLYVIAPYMELNGYELANGWWVEKPDGKEYPDYVVAHKYCANHKPSLINDKICGCFYCLEIFKPQEITDWLEGTKGDWEGTALCPYCEIDSVIGESSGYPITKEFLEKMHTYWFVDGCMCEMKTPFGSIEFSIDDQQIGFECFSPDIDKGVFTADKTFRLQFEFEPDGKPHRISARIRKKQLHGKEENGDNFIANSFYIKNGKITIACESPMGKSDDFVATIIRNGVEILVSESATEKTFKFGVAWVLTVAENNDNSTVRCADPMFGIKQYQWRCNDE